MHEIYYLLKAGKCRLMPFDSGVRNVHQGGIASMITKEKYCEVSLPMDREFYWRTFDKYAKHNYLATLDASVSVYKKDKKIKALYCAIVRFIIGRHPKTLICQIKEIYCFHPAR
jgi:hypothetical protein